MRSRCTTAALLRGGSGMTIVEMAVTGGIASMLLAAAALGLVTLQKSAENSRLYTAGMNDGCRVVDYIGRDLRNACRISRIDAGTASAFKSGSLEITADTQLAIFAPNFYVSNTPDNASGSDYKTPRYSRSRLSTGQSYFPYEDVVTVIGTSRYPKYPGEVEYRYLRRARSASDPTVCYYRQVYENGALRSEREIAEKVETAKVSVTAVDAMRFRIVTSFAPYITKESTRSYTRQFCTVQLPNRRKD